MQKKQNIEDIKNRKKRILEYMLLVFMYIFFAVGGVLIVINGELNIITALMFIPILGMPLIGLYHLYKSRKNKIIKTVLKILFFIATTIFIGWLLSNISGDSGEYINDGHRPDRW